MKDNKPFLTDVTNLRAKARANIEQGAITPAYHGDVKQTIDILQSVLATEIVCVLRYTQNAIAATGISSEGVKDEFQQHAKEEQGHMMLVAERINQLGGNPDFNPQTVNQRTVTEYGTSSDLMAMIKEDLVAERIVIMVYRKMIEWFGNDDPITRRMLEKILKDEENHADDLSELLRSR